jgi:hypothetical protein
MGRHLETKRSYPRGAIDHFEALHGLPQRFGGKLGEPRQAAAAHRPRPGAHRERLHRMAAASHRIDQSAAPDLHALADDRIVGRRLQ